MFPEQKTANFHIFAYLNPDTGYRILGAKILRILTTALAAQQKFNRNLNLLNPPPLSCFNYVWRWTQVAVKELVGLEVPGETGRILLPDTTWIFLKIIYLEQPEGNNQIII